MKRATFLVAVLFLVFQMAALAGSDCTKAKPTEQSQEEYDKDCPPHGVPRLEPGRTAGDGWKAETNDTVRDYLIKNWPFDKNQDLWQSHAKYLQLTTGDKDNWGAPESMGELMGSTDNYLAAYTDAKVHLDAAEKKTTGKSDEEINFWKRVVHGACLENRALAAEAKKTDFNCDEPAQNIKNYDDRYNEIRKQKETDSKAYQQTMDKYKKGEISFDTAKKELAEKRFSDKVLQSASNSDYMRTDARNAEGAAQLKLSGTKLTNNAVVVYGTKDALNTAVYVGPADLGDGKAPNLDIATAARQKMLDGEFKGMKLSAQKLDTPQTRKFTWKDGNFTPLTGTEDFPAGPKPVEPKKDETGESGFDPAALTTQLASIGNTAGTACNKCHSGEVKWEAGKFIRTHGTPPVATEVKPADMKALLEDPDKMKSLLTPGAKIPMTPDQLKALKQFAGIK